MRILGSERQEKARSVDHFDGFKHDACRCFWHEVILQQSRGSFALFYQVFLNRRKLSGKLVFLLLFQDGQLSSQGPVTALPHLFLSSFFSGCIVYPISHRRDIFRD